TSTGALYPDLRPLGLAVSPAAPKSGGPLTVSWNDVNSGDGPATIGWADRVVVVNTTTGQTLVDTTVTYNPAAPGNGPVAAGETRPRQHSFVLPAGAAGVGTLSVTVTADVTGVVFENNAAGTAESNNITTLTVASTPGPTANLVI